MKLYITRTERFLTNLFHFAVISFVMTMFFVMDFMLFSTAEPQARLAFLPLGFLSYGAYYFALLLALDRILKRGDSNLLDTTPLTRALFLRRGIVRNWGAIGSLYFLVPPIAAFLLAIIFSEAEEFHFTPARSVGLALNFLLLVWLTQAIVLHDRFCDRPWTRLFFFFRSMVLDYRRMPRAVWLGFAPMLLGILFGYIDAVRRAFAHESLPIIDLHLIDFWRAIGPACDLLHWVLSPLTAVAYICFNPKAGTGPWLLAGIQASLLIALATRLWRELRRDVREFCAQDFESWSAIRELFEEQQDALANRHRPGEAASSNYQTDWMDLEDDDSKMAASPMALYPGDSETHEAPGVALDRGRGGMQFPQDDPGELLPSFVAAIPYEEQHSPEEQMVRHRRAWHPAPWRNLSAPPWKAWLSLAGAGALTALLAGWNWSRWLKLDLLAQPAFVLAVLVMQTKDIERRLAPFARAGYFSALYPCRWTRLIRAIYGRELWFFFLYDILFALIPAFVFMTAWTSAVWMVLLFAGIRCNCFLVTGGQQLRARDTATDVPMLLAAIGIAVAFFCLLFFSIAFATSHPNMRTLHLGPVSLIEGYVPGLLQSWVLIAVACIQAFAAFCLAAALAWKTWRRGPQIVRSAESMNLSAPRPVPR